MDRTLSGVFAWDDGSGCSANQTRFVYPLCCRIPCLSWYCLRSTHTFIIELFMNLLDIFKIIKSFLPAKQKKFKTKKIDENF